MIYSGLDWSGSPGRDHGDFVTFAIVHFSEGEFNKLVPALESARQHAKLATDYVFKNSGSGHATKSAFFAALQQLDFTAHVHLLDKEVWAASQIGKPTGPRCIRDGILTLVHACPDHVVANQVLFVDIHPSQRNDITVLRTEIRQSLRTARPRRRGFSNVRGCEDHRHHGSIIQVADMIAGQAGESRGLGGRFLPNLGHRVTRI